MPLFGKKNSKSSSSGGASYPTQQPAYPTQQRPAYPTQQPAYPTQQPPPAYPPQPSQAPPQTYPPQTSGGAYPPPPQQQQVPPAGPPPGYTPVAYPPPPQPLVVTSRGSFDQGARFDPSKPVHIPPPPPGVAPTGAQVAAAQGQSVVMTQDKKDVLGGGSDGGMTIW